MRPVFAALALVLAVGHADAGPTDGMYYGNQPTPGNDFDGEGAIQCPGTARLQGNTLAFSVEALNGAHPIPYGAWKVKLDDTGTFHGKFKIPARPKFDHAIDYDDADRIALYKNLETVQIDIDKFDVGGGGTGLIFEITLPKKGDDSAEHCRRSLLRVPTPKPSKQYGRFDGAYWAHTGGGQGELLHCPGDIVVANGKVYMGVASRYTSWAATDLPVQKDGTFEADVAFAKLPSDERMKRAGYYDEDIKELHGGMAFHVKGKFSGITAAKTNKKSTSIDLEVRATESSNYCNATFLMQGFDLGDSFIDCDRLTGAERARHPVCN